MDSNIAYVVLEKAYRLINHGPTVLASARHDGVDNVMAAAWACALDYAPPKLTVVLDKSTKTRELVEKSGRFVIQAPTVAQLKLTHELGTHSLASELDQLTRAGVELFEMGEYDQPWATKSALQRADMMMIQTPFFPDLRTETKD